MPEIGATLREARMRARIDVSEIEASTKIRAKYLRALENEEWGLLPGPTFVKSFLRILRTYAQALGLDGKALVEEYRMSEEGAGDALHEPIVAGAGRTRPRRDGGGPSRGYLAAVGVIVTLIVLLVVLLVVGGGGSGKTHTPARTSATTPARSKHPRKHSTQPATSTTAGILSLQVRPTALVYVCLIGDDGRRLIPGQELNAGEATPVYHAHHFEIALGNSDVSLIIDGIPRAVAPSSEAIGYTITKAYGRRALAAGHLPTCT
jgi:hypothetical protein